MTVDTGLIEAVHLNHKMTVTQRNGADSSDYADSVKSSASAGTTPASTTSATDKRELAPEEVKSTAPPASSPSASGANTSNGAARPKFMINDILQRNDQPPTAPNPGYPHHPLHYHQAALYNFNLAAYNFKPLAAAAAAAAAAGHPFNASMSSPLQLLVGQSIPAPPAVHHTPIDSPASSAAASSPRDLSFKPYHPHHPHPSHPHHPLLQHPHADGADLNSTSDDSNGKNIDLLSDVDDDVDDDDDDSDLCKSPL